MDVQYLNLSSQEHERYFQDLLKAMPSELRIGTRETDAYNWMADNVSSKIPGIVDRDVTAVRELVRSSRPPAVISIQLPSPKDADLGPTPTEITTPEETTIADLSVMRGLLLAVMDIYVYGITSQANARLSGDVIPLASHRDTEQLSYSPKGLGPHVEDSYFTYAGHFEQLNGPSHGIAPDWLSLLFFRNPTRIGTSIFVPNWSLVTESNRRLLRDPVFPIQTSLAHGETRLTTVGPVLLDDSDNPALRFHGSFTQTEHLPSEYHSAFVQLQDSMEEREVDTPPGTVLLIDNKHAAHGRRDARGSGQYVADGKARWQQRSYGATNTERLTPYLVRPRMVDSKLFLAMHAEIVQ